jgi:hypothetical protein
MKTAVPQGFSRSLLSLSTCGYLPYSRQKCQKFARNHPQGYPQKFRKHDGAPNILRADKKRSSSLTRGWIQASAQIDRLARYLTVSHTHHSDPSDLFRATESSDRDSIGLNQIDAQHVCVNDCRRDQVCGDSYSGQVRPLRVRFSEDLILRFSLLRADYTTGIGSHRGNEDQPAPLGRGIAGTTADVTKKRRAQIKMDRPVQRREISIVEPLVSRDASAVHQDVDLTVLTRDRPGQQVDLFRVGDIRTDRDAPPSAFRDRRDNFIRCEFVFPIRCSPPSARAIAIARPCRRCRMLPARSFGRDRWRDYFAQPRHHSNGGCPSNFVHKTRTPAARPCRARWKL